MQANLSPAHIVIVAEPSAALRAALDTVDHHSCDVRVISPSAETVSRLRCSTDPGSGSTIRVILIEIGGPPSDVENLVARLRRESTIARTPIVLWGTTEAYRDLDLRNGSWVNSYVRTGPDPEATATLLTRTINYWASVNRSPDTRQVHMSAGETGCQAPPGHPTSEGRP